MSRMSFTSSFEIYDTSSDITIDKYKTWLTDLGYTVRCSISSVSGDKKIADLKKEDCKDERLNPKNN